MSRWGDNEANITKPTEGYIKQGFLAGPNSPIPSAIFNWWMQHVHRRLSGFYRSGAQAQSQAYLGDYDVFVSGYSILGGAHPGGSGLTLSQNCIDLDHDGEFLIVLEQGVAATTAAKVHIYDPYGYTSTRVHDLGTNDDYSAITCNGSRIAISRSNANGDVIVIDYDGATDFSYQHGAAVRDVCMDEDYVYCVGAEATGTVYGRGHLISDDGVTNWTFTRTTAGPDLWSCAVADDFVWFAGEGDAAGGNEDLYRLVKTSGATDGSLAMGGGTQEVFGKGRICIGPHTVYAATTSTSAGAGLIVYGVNRFGTLAIQDSEDLSSITDATWTGQITMDDRYLYIGDDMDDNYAIPYRESDVISVARAKLISPSSGALPFSILVSDGSYLYGARDGTETAVNIFGVGRRSGWWQKIRLDRAQSQAATSNTEAADWFRRKFIPLAFGD